MREEDTSRRRDEEGTLMRWTRSLLVVGLLMLMAPATASAYEQEHDPQLLQALRAIDTIPDRAALDGRFGDEAAALLMRAAADAELGHWVRTRALSLLSMYADDAQVRPFLEAQLGDEEMVVRRVATYTLGRAFGSPGDAALVAAIAGRLDDPERRVREHAARTLRWIDHADAGALLTRLAAEADDVALRRIAAQALERRAARLATAVQAPSTGPTDPTRRAP